ncbi:MAG: phosphate acyltransferase [Bacillaceae bacterium G1]|nr:phosphate acyltransferase PlsX [Bacillota bacterium]OJF16856.1 MAG: phosphate acyltransferase [Bacillaceae bacterium G1]
MRLAVDAMGGDHAPEEIVRGVLLALEDGLDVEFVLVGDERQIKKYLPKSDRRLHIYHTEAVITAEEEPVRAIRRKKDASLVVACQLVKDKEVDAMITAGNTGAFMAAGLLIVGRIPGVDRPALAPVLPTVDRRGVLLLDAGANMDAKPEHLVQYAQMGEVYVRGTTGQEDVRVGLLNVGTEAGKGNELTKAVFVELQKQNLHFVGNVEARDVPFGVCDVVVCDGFAGNILLKTMEGTGMMFARMLREVYGMGLLGKISALLIWKQVQALKKKLDYAEYGGAPLLGVDGLLIKSHGSSQARAIQQTIRQTAKAVQYGVVQRIAENIGKGESMG